MTEDNSNMQNQSDSNKKTVRQFKRLRKEVDGSQVIETRNSSVFKSGRHDEPRERDRESDKDEGDSNENEEKGDERIGNESNSIGKSDSFDYENMQVDTVEPEKRVTIKDIINSHKTQVRRKRKAKKVDVSPPSEKLEQETKITETPKPVAFHKRIIIVDGKPQIDQNSLMVEESHFRKAEDDPSTFKIIQDDEYASLNSLIYPKRSHTKKWSVEETDFFYKCLEQWGTDFSMIESKFNGARNRTQIKNKFRKEENENPERIEEALNRTMGIR